MPGPCSSRCSRRLRRCALWARSTSEHRQQTLQRWKAKGSTSFWLNRSLADAWYAHPPPSNACVLTLCLLIDSLSSQEIFWSGDEQWFAGVVESYNEVSKKHRIVYDDGDNKEHDLLSTKESYRFIDTRSEC